MLVLVVGKRLLINFTITVTFLGDPVYGQTFTMYILYSLRNLWLNVSEPKAKSSNEGHWYQGATRKFRKQGLMKNSTLKIVGHFFPKIQDKGVVMAPSTIGLVDLFKPLWFMSTVPTCFDLCLDCFYFVLMWNNSELART